MPTFRIHFADGTKLSVDANTAIEARKKAERQRPGNISKVKLAACDDKYPPTALAFATCFMFALMFCTAWMGIPA
ncbi:hypothetical protein [Mesorhizobium sp.]|uniref:hypothetical protein n=1 Tax=Mesorhizobium sp. TaxID=1871066 RepID=UPI000FE71384|nr:hypothetical protein [Mesorhizobium sp.]RWP31777.1 MAG: hypothetical protein EOR02_08145 [Mesorhizobium sp.]